LVNREDLMESSCKGNLLRSPDTKIIIPIYDDIKGIINKLKSNRTPVPDIITAELIKNGRNTFRRRIYKLILNI
jgi:hypothetical protein